MHKVGSDHVLDSILFLFLLYNIFLLTQPCHLSQSFSNIIIVCWNTYVEEIQHDEKKLTCQDIYIPDQ